MFQNIENLQLKWENTQKINRAREGEREAERERERERESKRE